MVTLQNQQLTDGAMAQVDCEDWQVGQLISVPYAWRVDSLWEDIRAETHERIGSKLRENYNILLQQPLSPKLLALTAEIQAKAATV